MVWAKLRNESSGREEIRGFLVEKGTKGFSAPEQKRKHSLRASVTSELILEDVHIPEANLLPDATGLKGPLGCLSQARFGIAFGVVGAAMACFHAAAEYSKVRVDVRQARSAPSSWCSRSSRSCSPRSRRRSCCACSSAA